MGSVTDECECPNCKNPNAILEVYYKRGTETIYCEKCGYNNDEDGKVTGGFGAFKILFNGGGTLGGFNKKYGIKQFEKEFKKGFKNGKGKKADEVSYTFKKDGRWYRKDLIKNIVYDMIKEEVIQRLK